jgi:hypothetical protein
MEREGERGGENCRRDCVSSLSGCNLLMVWEEGGVLVAEFMTFGENYKTFEPTL